MTYQQLLDQIEALGFEQLAWVLPFLLVSVALVRWLLGLRKSHLSAQNQFTSNGTTSNSANDASKVGQQIGGSGNTVSIHQGDPAITQLANNLFEAIQQKDQFLAQKDQKILELSLENQKLRMEAAITVAAEASKPTPSRLATLAKAEMLQGNLDAVNRLLTQLATNAAKKAPPQLVQAAHYARQRAAIWVGRDTRKAVAAFESAHKLHSGDIETSLALVDIYISIGDSPKAYAHAISALAVAAARCEQQPKSNDCKYWLALVHTRIGAIQKLQGKGAEALASCRAAQAVLSELVKFDCSNTQWLSDLSISHDKIGDLLRTQGQRTAAAKSYLDGMEIARNLAAKDETNGLWQFNLSGNYELSAGLEAEAGRFQDALRYQLAAMEIRSRFANVEAKNKQWQHSLAVGYINVGKYQYELKERLAAADSFNAGLKILERLVKANPTNVAWNRDLSTAHGLLGNYLAMEGKFHKALELYSQELDILKSLVKLDEKNVVWLHGLAKGFLSVGRVQGKLGLESDALKSLFKAQTILKKLSGLDAANTEYPVSLVRNAWEISCLAPRHVSYQEASTLLRNAQLTLAQLAAKRALTHWERGWNQAIAERLSSWQRLTSKNSA